MASLRDVLAVTASITLAASAGAAAQEPLRLWSVEADLSDYGVSWVGDVQRGRVSLVHDPASDRIALYSLRVVDTAPAPVSAPAATPRESPPPGRRGPAQRLRAMWVWNTVELLGDADERTAFLDFVSAQHIDRIFLYIPAAEGERTVAGFVPFDGDALAPLLGDLYARGALTYALDGDPSYVLEENRDGIVRTVLRVVDHNRTHPPEQRFYGVRYDIEPYLLPVFQGPRRGEILADWVEVISHIAGAATVNGLAVGVDLPFWLDAGDEETGEPFEAAFGDQRLRVLETVEGIVTDIGVMAYRTAADGPDGVLAQSAGELSLGGDRRAKVFIGVETKRLNDEDLYTFRGAGRLGLPPIADAAWVFLEDLGGDRVRVWLAEGPDAIAELERRVGSVQRLRYWFAGQPVRVPGDRLSFYSLGPDAMEAVTDRVVEQLEDDPAFLGLAFHDYEGLRALLRR